MPKTNQSWRVPKISSSLYKMNLHNKTHIPKPKKKYKYKSLIGSKRPKQSKANTKTYSFSPSLTWVPPNSGKRTLSPSFTLTGIKFPALSRAPGPTATTFPEFNYTPQSQPLDPQKKKKPTTTTKTKIHTHCVKLKSGEYLSHFLWEKNTSVSFGGGQDFLNQDTVKAWDQTLCHAFFCSKSSKFCAFFGDFFTDWELGLDVLLKMGVQIFWDSSSGWQWKVLGSRVFEGF